jgi:non-ribosomal peptide synthetase component F
MRYSNQEQIVVATDVANRTTLEAESLIGFFINLLAIRTDLSGNPPFRELLKRVRTGAHGAYSHQEMPFDKLVTELNPERGSSYSPVAQVQFNMVNTPTARCHLTGLVLEDFSIPAQLSKFDISVFMEEREDRIVCHWLYRAQLFDRATILRMGSHLENLLRNAVAHPDAALSALEFLSEEEKRQLENERIQRKNSHLATLRATEPRMVDVPKTGSE